MILLIDFVKHDNKTFTYSSNDGDLGFSYLTHHRVKFAYIKNTGVYNTLVTVKPND